MPFWLFCQCVSPKISPFKVVKLRLVLKLFPSAYQHSCLSDEVNPDYPHIQEEALRNILQPAGWELVPRSPVYPQFDSCLSEELQTAVKRSQNAMLLV